MAVCWPCTVGRGCSSWPWPSRWLSRLDALFGYEPASAAAPPEYIQRGRRSYLAWADALDRPDAYRPWPRPEPRPPIEARPTRLSVSSIEQWRRDPYAHPPAITPADPRYPGRDPRYQHLTDRELPLTENLSETLARVLPFWTETVMPALRQQQKVIVCAHGNSLRALVQYIDKLTDEQITQLDIVTGVPMVYQLNDNLERVNHYLLTE